MEGCGLSPAISADSLITEVLGTDLKSSKLSEVISKLFEFSDEGIMKLSDECRLEWERLVSESNASLDASWLLAADVTADRAAAFTSSSS